MTALISLLFAAMIQPSGNDLIGMYSSYVHGERWDFNIHRNDMDQTPRWSAFLDDPPLSPRRAIQAAESELNKLLPNANDWRLSAVHILPVAVQDSWVYMVEFLETPPGTHDGPAQSMSIVVLMTGRAIEPTHRPWPEKK
jgi:hypothetical protein